MDQAALVHVLEAHEDLREDHQTSLQTELAAAVVEQVFERRSQQLAHHIDVVLFYDDSLVFELGEAVASQVSQVLELDEQLWEPARYRLRLDGDLNCFVVAVDR